MSWSFHLTWLELRLAEKKCIFLEQCHKAWNFGNVKKVRAAQNKRFIVIVTDQSRLHHISANHEKRSATSYSSSKQFQSKQGNFDEGTWLSSLIQWHQSRSWCIWSNGKIYSVKSWSRRWQQQQQFCFVVLTQVHLSILAKKGREAAKRHTGHPVCHHPLSCCQTP